jgi:hypothetical protein
MSKQVYQIDPATHEFIALAVAYENPMIKLDGVPFNIPASCVEDAPPAAKEGFAIVREGNAWTYVADLRGKIIYSIIDKLPKIVDTLNPIPDDYTLLVPGRFSKWSKTKWVDDTEAVAAAKKEENNAPLLAALQAIDTQSIRALREWVLAQPNAPQFLKDHEKAAQPIRNKILK